ncbi:MAG: hypothetical protein ABIY56_03050 [Dokdonella sp.]
MELDRMHVHAFSPRRRDSMPRITSHHVQRKTPTGFHWRSRYGGALMVAMVTDVAQAGISGPWPDGNYVLTWWGADAAISDTCEVHASLAAAQHRVSQVVLPVVAATG